MPSQSPERVAHFLALQNALKFKGKANPKALLGAMVNAFPEYKQQMDELKELLDRAVAIVNNLSVTEQRAEILQSDPAYFQRQGEEKQERKEERKTLPALKDAVQGQVVTRIPPEPSKYNHLGHALSFLLNYLYAKKYEGNCLLRFEDTNPSVAAQEYVDAMRTDTLVYLDIKVDHETFVSDDMERFYQAVHSLLERGLVYCCTCSPTEMSADRRAKKSCVHREQTAEAARQWQEMLEGRTGMVLRLKINMQHKNAVMRDPVIFRVMTESHYRHGKKYKAWPMYDFENALEDSWTGITHVLRSNEFQDRVELHNHIKELFDLPKQVVQQYGRFNITGATTQGREIRKLIEEGKVLGWDDPRLITLRALRRRGIIKEALYELARKCGMSKTQTNLDFGVLAAINRQILDQDANRYFFVQDPVEFAIGNWPPSLTETELKLHPHKERGGRKLSLNGKFCISRQDYETVQDGKIFRLIDTCNLQYKEGSFYFHSQSIEDFKTIPGPKRHGLIHFLPLVEGQELLKARVLWDDATYRTGLLEPTAKGLAEGVILQLERYAFVRLDAIEKDGTRTFWYTHA